jgi:hypothetical protein
MTYAEQRSAVLAHAQAAALAVDSKWTNVATGWPTFNTSKGCRVFYGGETEAPRMPHQSTIRGDQLVGEKVTVVAWWAVPGLNDGATTAIDDEMFAFKHELRTRLTADPDLGGKSVSTVMDYVEPDAEIMGGTRYAFVRADVIVGHTEYLNA